MLSSMLARGKIKLTQVSASLIFYKIQFYRTNEIPRWLLFLDSTYTEFTHFLMQMSPLKQLWGENPLCSHYNARDACCCYSGQSFFVALLCLPSNNALEERGAAALSSLARLPTYNIHDYAVYFCMNKAHPFKFNLEAGLSAVFPPHYLWEINPPTATTACSLF